MYTFELLYFSEECTRIIKMHVLITHVIDKPTSPNMCHSDFKAILKKKDAQVVVKYAFIE